MRARSALAVALVLALAAPACSRGGGAPEAVPFVPVDPHSASPTDQAIGAAQKKLRVDPNDPSAQLALAQAFLQKARETADPTLYLKAGQLLDRLTPGYGADIRVLVSKGTLALAQHRFADGLTIGRQGLLVAPGNEGAYGIVVDADNELGRYREAEAATQQMANVRPNLSSLSRVSYTRELRGDLPGAILAMTQAVAAAGTTSGENVAYVEVLLGNLLLTKGDRRSAASTYARAERAFKGFPAARVGQAKILVASGQYGRAADLLGQVVQIQPLAEYAIAWGDALDAAGRHQQARDAYALVDTIASLYRANGVNVDLELALFDADHRPGAAAVERARQAERERPSILGHDVLAWNLLRAHQIPEASREIARALSTGSRDPQIRYHAAAIAAAAGDLAAAARHLRIVMAENPRFSAHLIADVAALARRLGIAMPPPVT